MKKKLIKVKQLNKSEVEIDQKEIKGAEVIKKKSIELRNLVDKKRSLEKEIDIIEDRKKEVVENLVELFEIYKIQSIVFKEVGNVFLHISKFPLVKDSEILVKWLKEKKLYEIVMSFNKKKLGTLIKERAEDNEEIPPGIELFTKTEVRIRK